MIGWRFPGIPRGLRQYGLRTGAMAEAEASTSSFAGLDPSTLF
jgi:hypothetical protein